MSGALQNGECLGLADRLPFGHMLVVDERRVLFDDPCWARFGPVSSIGRVGIATPGDPAPVAQWIERRFPKP